jgi:predicted amidophosphoribosyltransferase
MNCPVCGARFRGVRVCSRCGASLEPLMRIVIEAWERRESVRSAMRPGDLPAALRSAREAQRLCPSPAGAALERVAALGVM